jgi:hypothetical protein
MSGIYCDLMMEGRVDGPFRRSSPCFLLVAQIDRCTCVPLIHLDADAMELLASPLDGVIQSSPVVSTLLAGFLEEVERLHSLLQSLP